VIPDRNHHKKPFASLELFQTLGKTVKTVRQVSSVEKVPVGVPGAKQVLILVQEVQSVINARKTIIVKKAQMLRFLVRQELERAPV
jgi:hypothetical protein